MNTTTIMNENITDNEYDQRRREIDQGNYDGRFETARVDTTRAITRGDRQIEWNRMSIGYCVRCGEGHALIDGICGRCRYINTETDFLYGRIA